MPWSKSTGKLSSLQLLRAVAVLLVVYCHTLDHQPQTTIAGTSFQQHFFYLQNFGAVGVDIFFVISGFIITIISVEYAANNKAGLFFIKRLIRIVPVYWLVSFLLLLHYIRIGQPVLTAAINKTIFLFPFFDHKVFDMPILSIGWTLSFEMFFYIVVFAAMLFKRKWYIQVALVFLVSVIAFNFITHSDNRFFAFMGNGIVLEFLLGAVIGLVFLSPAIINPPVTSLLLITGVLALLATIIFGYGDISEAWSVWAGTLSFHRVLIWGLPSALLVAGVVFKEKKKTVLIHRWWILLGDASYSIYLTHTLILGILYVRLIKWGITEKIAPDLLIVLCMLFAVTGGCIFYKLVELPLLRFLNKQVERVAHKKSVHKG